MGYQLAVTLHKSPKTSDTIVIVSGQARRGYLVMLARFPGKCLPEHFQGGRMVQDGRHQRGRRGVDAAHLAQQLVGEIRLAHLMGFFSRALLIGVFISNQSWCGLPGTGIYF